MTMQTVENIEIVKITRGQSQTVRDRVVTEIPFAIWLNGKPLATIVCTPTHYRELAVGFLLSERIVTDASDIQSIEIDEMDGSARIEARESRNAQTDADPPRFITPGCLFGAASVAGREKVEATVCVASDRIHDLVAQTARLSTLYQSTGGVHSAALCSTDDVVVFREDIGRHNAIDKVLGHCVLEGIDPCNHLLITSGRISSAVTAKIINAQVPVMVSSSAPTSEAVKLADAFGITLVGFVRGRRMNIYTGEERIADLN